MSRRPLLSSWLWVYYIPSPHPRILLHPCSLPSKVFGPRPIPTPQSHPTATAFKIVASLLSMPIPAAAHQRLLSPKLAYDHSTLEARMTPLSLPPSPQFILSNQLPIIQLSISTPCRGLGGPQLPPYPDFFLSTSSAPQHHGSCPGLGSLTFMSASNCRPSCGLWHPMAKLQNVWMLGTIPLFARTGSSAYGNRHGITISCTPPAPAKALSVKALGWMLEIREVELCSKASGSLCWPH